MLMSTNSYLEFYLSLLAWIINNGLWSVLSDTGLFAAPFGAIILQEWLSARQQGADEGNKDCSRCHGSRTGCGWPTSSYCSAARRSFR